MQAEIGHVDEFGKVCLPVQVLGVHLLALLPRPLLNGLLGHIDGHAEAVHQHHLVLEHLLSNAHRPAHDAVVFGHTVITPLLGGQQSGDIHIDARQHPLDVLTCTADLGIHRILLQPRQLQRDIDHGSGIHKFSPLKQ